MSSLSGAAPNAAAIARAASEILEMAGAGSESARIVADSLIESDMMGHASHGLRMLPLYVERLRGGDVDGGTVPTIVIDHGAVVKIDANRCFGQVAGGFAAKLGVARARDHGVALVTISNSGHFGRNGKWPELAAGQGVASLHFGKGRNGAPMIAPFGGAAPRLFSSPIALGTPGPNPTDGPIILDFAVAETSINAVRRAAERGEMLPSACVVTADGQFSADPNVLLDATRSAAIACFGGFKGYGLAIFAEVFAGILAVGPATDDRPENSMLSIYLDIDRLIDRQAYAEAVAALSRSIRDCPPVDGLSPVAMPGDRARHRMTQALAVEAMRASLDRAAKLAGMDASPGF